MAREMRVLMRGLHRVKSNGRVYFYAWRGGPRLETSAPLGSPEFHAAYNAAVASKAPRTSGTFKDLIALYENSTEFTGRSKRTKSDYTKHLRAIETKWGKLPLAAVSDPRLRGDFKEWRDKLARKSLRQADYAWSVLQRVFSVAKDRGRITVNPCERGGRLYEADRTDKIWTAEDEANFVAVAPPH